MIIPAATIRTSNPAPSARGAFAMISGTAIALISIMGIIAAKAPDIMAMM